MVVPQAVLSQPALAAYQQQALSAWAAGAQQPHPMSYQLIQSLLSNLQNNSRDKMPACASVAPPAGTRPCCACPIFFIAASVPRLDPGVLRDTVTGCNMMLVQARAA